MDPPDAAEAAQALALEAAGGVSESKGGYTCIQK